VVNFFFAGCRDCPDHPPLAAKPMILETGMERDEDGVVLGSTRLSGSQRLHRKGDATREAGSLVGPMTAADSPSAISVFRMIHLQNSSWSRRALIPSN
jgi:hypothetical protein